MNKLEQYFDQITGTQVNKNILDKYEEYGFESEADYKLIVEFLMETIYNLEWSDTVADIKTRPNQKQFAQLVGKRDTRCVITGRIKGECVASHIVEVKNGGDFTVDNGLLLESGLHQTFDKQLWCINPDTLTIEVKPHHDPEATIRKYEGKKIKFIPSGQMIANLKIRYQDYLTHGVEQ